MFYRYLLQNVCLTPHGVLVVRNSSPLRPVSVNRCQVSHAYEKVLYKRLHCRHALNQTVAYYTSKNKLLWSSKDFFNLMFCFVQNARKIFLSHFKHSFSKLYKVWCFKQRRKTHYVHRKMFVTIWWKLVHWLGEVNNAASFIRCAQYTKLRTGVQHFTGALISWSCVLTPVGQCFEGLWWLDLQVW